MFSSQFIKNQNEVTTRSFPFSFEIRKQMILESFDYNENIQVLGDYAFVFSICKVFFSFFSSTVFTIKKKNYF